MFLEAEALSSRVWRLPSSREKYVCFLTDGKSFVIRWRKIKRVYNRNSKCKKRKTTHAWTTSTCVLSAYYRHVLMPLAILVGDFLQTRVEKARL